MNIESKFIPHTNNKLNIIVKHFIHLCFNLMAL